MTLTMAIIVIFAVGFIFFAGFICGRTISDDVAARVLVELENAKEADRGLNTGYYENLIKDFKSCVSWED